MKDDKHVSIRRMDSINYTFSRVASKLKPQKHRIPIGTYFIRTIHSKGSAVVSNHKKIFLEI